MAIRDGEEYVAVDAGRGTGPERERDKAGGRVGQLRGEVGRTRAAERSRAGARMTPNGITDGGAVVAVRPQGADQASRASAPAVRSSGGRPPGSNGRPRRPPDLLARDEHPLAGVRVRHADLAECGILQGARAGLDAQLGPGDDRLLSHRHPPSQLEHCGCDVVHPLLLWHDRWLRHPARAGQSELDLRELQSVLVDLGLQQCVGLGVAGVRRLLPITPRLTLLRPPLTRSVAASVPSRGAVGQLGLCPAGLTPSR
jgi:hypothetical protein